MSCWRLVERKQVAVLPSAVSDRELEEPKSAFFGGLWRVAVGYYGVDSVVVLPLDYGLDIQALEQVVLSSCENTTETR